MSKGSPFGPAVGLGSLLAFAAAPLAAAELSFYLCNENGVASFSEAPCGPAPKQITLEYDRAGPAAESEHVQGAVLETKLTAKRALWASKIVNTRQLITGLSNEEQFRIAELTRKRFQGTEKRDLDTYRTRMNARILAVTNDYEMAIDRAFVRLEELEAQHAALPSVIVTPSPPEGLYR